VKKRAYLAFININTRKAYVYEMGDKSTAQVIEALKKFLSAVKNVKILQSDQDSAYLSKEFLDIIRNKHIGYTTTTDNDHHLLGIVNRFIHTIRDVNRDEDIPNIVKVYNDTPHRALPKASIQPDKGSTGYFTPNEINPKLEQAYIQWKEAITKETKQNRVIIPVGARVRVRFPTKALEKKRSNFSSQSYIINRKIGNQYQIKAEDGSTDIVPWFSVLPVKAGAKSVSAPTIKNAKRKNVKEILEYNATDNSYRVIYEDNITENIPTKNLREGRPAIPTDLEKAFLKNPASKIRGKWHDPPENLYAFQERSVLADKNMLDPKQKKAIDLFNSRAGHQKGPRALVSSGQSPLEI
jgi:hypothetical protein